MLCIGFSLLITHARDGVGDNGFFNGVAHIFKCQVLGLPQDPIQLAIGTSWGEAILSAAGGAREHGALALE